MKTEEQKIDDARSFLKSNGIDRFTLMSQKCADEISFQEEGSPCYIRLEAFKEILKLDDKVSKKCECCGKELPSKGLKFNMIIVLIKKPFDFCRAECRDKWCKDNNIIKTH